MRRVGAVKEIFRGALDELCPGVERLAREAMDAGWRVDPSQAYCCRCGASAGPGAATASGCPFCANQPVPWQRLTRLGLYAPPLDEWVRAMKFHRQWRWAPWLGGQLARAIGPVEAERVIVCPVPMHWLRRWRRGYDQATLLAREVGRRRNWPVASLLRRKRLTLPQVSLPPSKRAANVRGSFAIVPVDLTGCHVVLVDDVKTTGATLGACARLLRKAGVEAVHAAVVAVADPQGRRFAFK